MKYSSQPNNFPPLHKRMSIHTSPPLLNNTALPTTSAQVPSHNVLNHTICSLLNQIPLKTWSTTHTPQTAPSQSQITHQEHNFPNPDKSRDTHRLPETTHHMYMRWLHSQVFKTAPSAADTYRALPKANISLYITFPRRLSKSLHFLWTASRIPVNRPWYLLRRHPIRDIVCGVISTQILTATSECAPPSRVHSISNTISHTTRDCHVLHKPPHTSYMYNWFLDSIPSVCHTHSRYHNPWHDTTSLWKQRKVSHRAILHPTTPRISWTGPPPARQTWCILG